MPRRRKKVLPESSSSSSASSSDNDDESESEVEDESSNPPTSTDSDDDNHGQPAVIVVMDRPNPPSKDVKPPPTSCLNWRTWSRRRKIAVSVSAIVLVGLLACLGTVTWFHLSTAPVTLFLTRREINDLTVEPHLSVTPLNEDWRPPIGANISNFVEPQSVVLRIVGFAMTGQSVNHYAYTGDSVCHDDRFFAPFFDTRKGECVIDKNIEAVACDMSISRDIPVARGHFAAGHYNGVRVLFGAETAEGIHVADATLSDGQNMHFLLSSMNNPYVDIPFASSIDFSANVDGDVVLAFDQDRAVMFEANSAAADNSIMTTELLDAQPAGTSYYLIKPIFVVDRAGSGVT